MTPSIASIMFALVSFIITFTVARAIAKWFKKRQMKKDEETAVRSQSRQVRRARARKDGDSSAG